MQLTELTIDDLYRVYAYHFKQVYDKFPAAQHNATEDILKAQIKMLQYIQERNK